MDWWSEGKHFWWLLGTISKLKKSSRVMTHRVWSQTIWIPLMMVMMKRFHKTSQSIHPVDVWASEVDHVPMEGGLICESIASCFLIPRRNSCVCMHNIRQMIAKGLDNITQWKYAKKVVATFHINAPFTLKQVADYKNVGSECAWWSLPLSV